jgi:hypothetical protein
MATVTTRRQDFSNQLQRPAQFIAVEDAAQPNQFIRRPEKRVISVDVGVLSLDDIVDFADRFACHFAYFLEVFGNEAEMLGIDVALFDETARLLRTTAGIGLVHEPALTIHEGV